MYLPSDTGMDGHMDNQSIEWVVDACSDLPVSRPAQLEPVFLCRNLVSLEAGNMFCVWPHYWLDVPREITYSSGAFIK